MTTRTGSLAWAGSLCTRLGLVTADGGTRALASAPGKNVIEPIIAKPTMKTQH